MTKFKYNSKAIIAFVIILIIIIPIIFVSTVKADSGLEFRDQVEVNGQEYTYLGTIKDQQILLQGTQETPYFYKLYFFTRQEQKINQDETSPIVPLNNNEMYAYGVYEEGDQHLVNFTIANNHLYFIGTQNIDICQTIFQMNLDGTFNSLNTECQNTGTQTTRLYGISNVTFIITSNDDKDSTIKLINEINQISELYTTSNNIDVEYFMYDKINYDEGGIYFREYSIEQNIDSIKFINKNSDIITVKEFDSYNYMIIFFQKKDVFFAIIMDQAVKEMKIVKLDPIPNGIEEIYSTTNIEEPREQTSFEFKKLKYRNTVIYDFMK